MFTRFANLPLLPWLLAAALVIRLAAAVVVHQWVEKTPGRLCLIEGDAAGYWELARHLVRGEEFAIYHPPRHVERMPGFPLVLALAIELFGENLLLIRFFLAIVGTGACGLVYFLGRNLFDHTTGLIACLLASASPVFAVFSVLLLSETLFALTLLANLLALVKLSQSEREPASGANSRRRVLLAVIAGLLAGAATLVRPTWLLVPPTFAAVYLFAPGDRKGRLVPLVVLLSAFAVTLVPWTVRNHRVTGHFVSTTLWVGPSLYDGLWERATGISDMQFIETDGLYKNRGMSEYDNDRHYRALAARFVREHPLRAIELAGIKLWRFWNPVPNADQFGHWAIRLAVGLFEWPALVMAGLGLWHTRKSLWCWLPAAGPAFYFSLVHAVFIGSIRYRLPAEYALLVLTAVGFRWIWTHRAS